MNKQNLMSIIQWFMIFLLIIIVMVLSFKSCEYKNETDMLLDDYKQENNYLKVYSSQRINALSKENKELYNKVEKLQNVETATEIRYVYTFNTDTVYVFASDTINGQSVYHFESDDDTINYKLDIQGKSVDWFKLDFKINDKLTLINQNSGDVNKLTIQPNSSHMDITGVDAWHKQNTNNKWYNKINFGPQIGVGYGFITHKPDVFVGFSVGYDLRKRK